MQEPDPRRLHCALRHDLAIGAGAWCGSPIPEQSLDDSRDGLQCAQEFFLCCFQDNHVNLLNWS